jgi:hypothetical protein
MMPKLRLALLFASSVSLAGCGGGNSQDGPAASLPQVAIGGTVTGLPTGATLILTNGSEDIAIHSSGGYLFAKKVPAGADYNASIFGSSAGLACRLSNGAGKVNASAGTISNINVACELGMVALIPFYVAVTVSGLSTGNSLTLTNNGTDTLTATDNGFFIIHNGYAKEGVYSGRAGGYNVAVQTSPKGQICSVSNASGAFSLGQSGDLVNVQAVCK